MDRADRLRPALTSAKRECRVCRRNLITASRMPWSKMTGTPCSCENAGAGTVALVKNNMKMKKPFIYILLTLSFLVILPTRVPAEELDVINRPVNVSGLSGLLVTTLPFSLEPGAVETGIAVFSENSKRPDYTISEYIATISVGTGKGTEIAVRGSSISIKSLP